MRITLPALLLASLALAACQPLPAPGQAETQTVLAHTTVLPATPLSFPTLPPEWTPTWTPAPSPVPPTAAPSATPSAPYSQRLAAAKADITRATSLANSGQYSTALPIWNKIIAAVPEYANAYYWRTVCIMHLSVNLTVEADFIAGMRQALSDMNTALDLDARNGDYYYERQAVYANLATLELYRVDQDYWHQLALNDIQAAERFGTGAANPKNFEGFALIDAGHPQAAFNLFSQLPPVPGKTVQTDPGLQEGLAESLFAEGFLDEALTHVDLAIKLSPSGFKAGDKATILLSQGKLDEALAQINLYSDGAGGLCGCAYYTRALIYYQQGKTSLAQADIDAGTRHTWTRGGLRSYVLGLIALDKGDQATGTQLLQEAQASLPRSDGPVLLKQIQDRLDKLGAKRLDPTPYAVYVATPMPTPP